MMLLPIPQGTLQVTQKFTLGWAFLIWSPKLFECQHDVPSGKFHTWPHMIGCSQNTDMLRRLYKITFRLCVWGSYDIQMNSVFRFGSHPQDPYYVYANITESEKKFKHIWSQAFQIKATQPLFVFWNFIFIYFKGRERDRERVIFLGPMLWQNGLSQCLQYLHPIWEPVWSCGRQEPNNKTLPGSPTWVTGPSVIFCPWDSLTWS